MAAALGPRLVVAGTNSGVGKTTVATGLLAALRRRGVVAAPAKVGPDFIDPGYHALAAGRPSRNLDAWICGPDLMAPLAARAGAGADVLVVEGVMGLFDGPASTAQVATLLDAPVVLVVDAAAMSGSVAAMVHGYMSFDPAVRVAGVILNRVGSDGHEALLREALAPLEMPVLGVLRRDDAFAWRDRHLGLVPVVEQPDAVRRSLDRLAQAVAQGCDLDALMALARTAPVRTEVADPPTARRTDAVAGGPVRIAVAGGPAFSFTYPDNLELLVQAGAELVPFDPLCDAALPAGVAGLYAGGGFPEVFVQALAANRPLLDDVRARVAGGLTTWAECGGLLWLARSLDGLPLAGAVPADGRMTDRLTLGYRTATVGAGRDNPLAAAGTVLRGHEFHYSVLDPAGDALALEGRLGGGPGGWACPTLLASYLHLHLAAVPEVAERFVAATAAAAAAAAAAAGR
ncbi:MAG: cobyrinic acid a,c-diamide synthase [Acidimicrobiaceae bacterium]|nr:cobyrinic acid a,c-diamide synthase [Acidimicrobiaceae bacterium]